MVTRRDFLTAGAGLGALALSGWAQRVPLSAPSSAVVGLARCPSYEFNQVLGKLSAAIDLIGGLRSLVNGKTVAIKLNLTGDIAGSFQGLPAQRTYQTHSSVTLALVHLLHAAGASRIRLIESMYRSESLESQLAMAGWDISAFTSVGTTVEFEDTRNLGDGAAYSTLSVPGGGLVFSSFMLNHSYEDTDVFISVAKLKEHAVGGITLSLKNSFGIAPLSLYGNDAGSEEAVTYRGDMFHQGTTAPPSGVPQEIDPESPRDALWRVPHLTVDLAACRPIDLAIIDGVETIRGGEGPWIPGVYLDSPGILTVGRDPVATDAATMQLMGHNPQAADGTPPFPGVNHVALAASAGLGTNDPEQIEVREVGMYSPRSGILVR